MADKIAKIITFDHREYARLQEDCAELHALKLQFKVLEEDQALLVAAINKQPAFEAWLLEQDNTSTMIDGRPGMGYGKGHGIEGKTDEQLAIAFAKHVMKGSR